MGRSVHCLRGVRGNPTKRKALRNGTRRRVRGTVTPWGMLRARCMGRFLPLLTSPPRYLGTQGPIPLGAYPPRRLPSLCLSWVPRGGYLVGWVPTGARCAARAFPWTRPFPRPAAPYCPCVHPKNDRSERSRGPWYELEGVQPPRRKLTGVPGEGPREREGVARGRAGTLRGLGTLPDGELRGLPLGPPGDSFIGTGLPGDSLGCSGV